MSESPEELERLLATAQERGMDDATLAAFRQLIAQQGSSAPAAPAGKMIHPKPGFVVKTRIADPGTDPARRVGDKVFINVCSHPDIPGARPKPTDASDGTDQPGVAISLSVGPPRPTQDAAGAACVAVDAIMSPALVSDATREAQGEAMSWTVGLVSSYVERRYGWKLQEAWSLPRITYKEPVNGSTVAQYIRAAAGSRVQEVPEPGAAGSGVPASTPSNASVRAGPGAIPASARRKGVRDQDTFDIRVAGQDDRTALDTLKAVSTSHIAGVDDESGDSSTHAAVAAAAAVSLQQPAGPTLQEKAKTTILTAPAPAIRVACIVDGRVQPWHVSDWHGVPLNMPSLLPAAGGDICEPSHVQVTILSSAATAWAACEQRLQEQRAVPRGWLALSESGIHVTLPHHQAARQALPVQLRPHATAIQARWTPGVKGITLTIEVAQGMAPPESGKPDVGSKPWTLRAALREDGADQHSDVASVSSPDTPRPGPAAVDTAPVHEDEELPEDRFHRADALSMHYITQREAAIQEKRTEAQQRRDAAGGAAAGLPPAAAAAASQPAKLGSAQPLPEDVTLQTADNVMELF